MNFSALAFRTGKPVHRKLLLHLIDFCIVTVAYLAAWLSARFIEKVHASWSELALEFLCIIAAYICASLVFRVNDIIWRYATGHEYLYIFSVAAFSGAVSCLFIHFVLGACMPVVYYLMGELICACGLTLSRMVYREFINKKFKYRFTPDSKRLLIVGAGAAGSRLLEEIRSMPSCGLAPVGFVDDNSQKIGRSIYGVRILGTVLQLEEICRREEIEIIYIAIPSLSNERRAEMLELCLKTQCTVKILPRAFQIADKNALLRSIRDITPEELLGREVVNVADDKILHFVSGKTVLITGGGGSIGSEICRQVAANHPRRMVIIDVYENTTYDIQQELIRKYGDELDLVVYIATVCDYPKIESLFEKERPDIVIHAAAHKHVPLMETVPDEAIKNNVFGTYNTIMAARHVKVDKMILISTDKAVNPTNIMGTTKRICEMLIQYADTISPDITFAAVRFGNVLGSNGSVIPLFKQQIENRCDVTVTHPEMTRYFMTISEASQLVLTASAMAKGGEIFVLDMGQPVKIDDLARKMIRLAGLTVDRDIHIRYIGLRPGEKLYEELLMNEEGLHKTLNEKIYIGKKIPMDYEQFRTQLEELHMLANDTSTPYAVLEQKLAEIVPTFHRNPADHSRHEVGEVVHA